MRTLIWLCALSAAGLASGQNLFPDPGFERSGRVGEAHSGQRAGYLSVGAEQHWVTLNAKVDLEPYATYRATAWVKGRTSKGLLSALFCYAWDSYIWAFSTSAPIPNGGDWAQVETTFICPPGPFYLHPLAFTDAADAEAWIDDVVIERIADPAQTIAGLRAKPLLTENETRLMARWYLANDQRDAAKALLETNTSPQVKADIAYLLAMSAATNGERALMAAVMMNQGATGYNDGPKRLAEVMAKLDLAAALPTMRASAQAANSPSAWATYASGLTGLWQAEATRPQSLTERRQKLAILAAEADRIAVALAGQPLPDSVHSLGDVVRAARRDLEQQMKQLGTAIVTIGGVPVTAASHVILTAAQPTPSERTAAVELQTHLEQITGQGLAIVAGQAPVGKARLVVGKHPLVATLGLKPDDAKLGLEGTYVRTVGRDLVLYGGQRGVLYAVYDFLENQLGCRWFAPDCATWPTSGRIAVPELNKTYLPPLEYRATDYPNSRPPEFAVRNRLNGTQIAADASWGGKISYVGFVHTFDALVPVAQYFDTHPEYFSEIDGKRVRDHTQLCLTNPEVLRIATETVLRWLSENPEATIVSVSQNDWRNPCACANCRAVLAEEGAESGVLLRFVNAIAAEVTKHFPYAIVDTLAYQYTRQPPKITRPAPNVAVRLCSIECEFNRPLETSDYNRTFVDDIRGWNAICDRLHIWDYVINYAHSIMPFPNLDVLKPNINFFINNGVTGIYEEANYYSKGGELAELRTYLMAKALWQPDYDLARARREFCTAYYGPAAPQIEAYLDDIHRLAVSDPNYHMPIYIGPQSPFQTPEALHRYMGWFRQAEAAVAEDPVRLHRVQVAKLPVLYSLIVLAGRPEYQLFDKTLRPVVGDSTDDWIAEFTRVAKAEGVTMISEGRSLDEWLAQFGTVGQDLPVERLQGTEASLAIVPGTGGRALVWRLADGRDLFALSKVGDGFDPSQGGYEEFSQGDYRTPGWREAYQVISSDSRSVTLAADLPNGLRAERRYMLSPDGLTLSVRSVLRNASQQPVSAAIRTHPELAMQDAATASLRLAGQEPQPLGAGADKETELWFRGDARPSGEWRFERLVGDYGVTVRFKPEQVETAYLNWNGPAGRLNPELFGVRRDLAPGQDLVLETEYAWSR